MTEPTAAGGEWHGAGKEATADNWTEEYKKWVTDRETTKAPMKLRVEAKVFEPKPTYAEVAREGTKKQSLLRHSCAAAVRETETRVANQKRRCKKAGQARRAATMSMTLESMGWKVRREIKRSAKREAHGRANGRGKYDAMYREYKAKTKKHDEL